MKHLNRNEYLEILEGAKGVTLNSNPYQVYEFITYNVLLEKAHKFNKTELNEIKAQILFDLQPTDIPKMLNVTKEVFEDAKRNNIDLSHDPQIVQLAASILLTKHK